MAKSLVDFLEELDSNAKLKEAYLKDPVATASAYGLADEDVKIIENKDWEVVQKLFEGAGKSTKTISY
ncbi:hypothetical protein [uncultured Paraglaciecola sp.]|mgnify:CR=1 FL=1|jgi:hypothetical protein|uniref:hypothetical protein n=1 Tax=uncultured Paraglaciecola sp. TaxID=1765024 RepID=UPI0025D152DB|nr:hypothetical protein [uncultured Paraglaciecola sp.]